MVLCNLLKTQTCCLGSNLCGLLLIALIDVKLILNHSGNFLKRSDAVLVDILHSSYEEVVVVDGNHI